MVCGFFFKIYCQQFYFLLIFVLIPNYLDTLEEALQLIRTSLNSPQMDVEGTHYDQKITHLIVVMGASVMNSFSVIDYNILLNNFMILFL